MAKKRKTEVEDEGIYVEEPKADVYMVLLILTFFSMLIATGVMYFEYSYLK